MTMTKWKLMPEEPTEDMLIAKVCAPYSCFDVEYKAMYAAAPEAPRLSDEEIDDVMFAYVTNPDMGLKGFVRLIEDKVRGE